MYESDEYRTVLINCIQLIFEQWIFLMYTQFSFFLFFPLLFLFSDVHKNLFLFVCHLLDPSFEN